MRYDNVCLRCGGTLPENAAPSRLYCNECAAERNRELKRERLARARKKACTIRQAKQDVKDRAWCKKCAYYGSEEYGGNLCDYLLRTGKRRGCKAGEGCERREAHELED